MPIFSYFRKSAPSAPFTGDDAARMKLYKKLRFQSFIAGTVGYSLYYVCRTSLNVVKKPILESGALDASQLGLIGSALLFAWLSGGSILGGVLASLICLKRIHTWIAQVGGVGMTLGCVLLAVQPYGSPLFLPTLALTGFMAAGYLVPLNALLQDRADNDKRGDVIAAGNLVDCFLGIMAVLVQQAMSNAGLSAAWQCGIMAVLSAAVALFIIRTMRRLA